MLFGVQFWPPDWVVVTVGMVAEAWYRHRTVNRRRTLTPLVQNPSKHLTRRSASGAFADYAVPNEQCPNSPGHILPTWRAPLQDVALMPQHQDFGFKPSSRLKAIAQADEKEGNCEYPAIML
jgi:hypothetical protein